MDIISNHCRSSSSSMIMGHARESSSWFIIIDHHRWSSSWIIWIFILDFRSSSWINIDQHPGSSIWIIIMGQIIENYHNGLPSLVVYMHYHTRSVTIQGGTMDHHFGLSSSFIIRDHRGGGSMISIIIQEHQNRKSLIIIISIIITRDHHHELQSCLSQNHKVSSYPSS